MKAYYNEFDPSAAAWLRELIKMKLITNGVVDERSITNVDGKELREFDRVHLFAGIGGWEYALQLAGFEGRVFTGSAPCQPFSSAGNQKGKADERHLWPHMFRLIRECRPEIVLGEQVDGAIKHGWLDDLCDDLEGENYTVRASVLAAAGIGAPHIRKRLYWVAYTPSERSKWGQRTSSTREEGISSRSATNSGADGRLGDSEHEQHERSISIVGTELSENSSWEASELAGSSEVDGVAYTNGEQAITSDERGLYSESSSGSRMGNTEHDGQFANKITSSDVQPSEEWGQDRENFSRESEGASRSSDAASISGRKDGCGEWHNPDWIYCRDNKYRPIHPEIKPLVGKFEPGTFKMADGLPEGVGSSSDPGTQINANETQEARVMRLKGYGNAIVPQLAAEFILSAGLLNFEMGVYDF